MNKWQYKENIEEMSVIEAIGGTNCKQRNK
jgi:hypothetical protein